MREQKKLAQRELFKQKIKYGIFVFCDIKQNKMICRNLSLSMLNLKARLSFSTLQSSLNQKTLTQKRQPHHDLVFVRHAESLFNQACQQYRQKNNIPYIWNELTQHEGFNDAVLFNPKYMDCALTEKGKHECKRTQFFFQDIKIDCVVVSPQLRALQTCQNIFENFLQLPVFVEPLLVGPLRSTCDVNLPTNVKKAMFPNFDFSQTQNYQELWYLDYLQDKQKQVCHIHFEKNNVLGTDDKRIQILKLMREKKVYEDALTFRKRIQDVKSLLDKYREKYERIAVVTHYYTIQYISAMEYQEDGSPEFYIDIKNCKPYFASLTDVLSLSQKNS